MHNYVDLDYYQSVVTALDENKRALTSLHESFRSGKLKLLIGAGLSLDQGLPSWERLVARIVDMYLRKRHSSSAGSSTKFWRGPSEDDVHTLLSRIGSTTVLDFIRRKTTNPDQFLGLLAHGLYRGRLLQSNNVSRSVSIRQVCLMAWEQLQAHQATDFLYTTNYDPLLEIGLKTTAPPEFADLDPIHFTANKLSNPPSGGGRAKVTKVHHVHGCLFAEADDSFITTPDGLIVTESDYQALTASSRKSAWLKQLGNLFDNSSDDILILGMSLSDPHVRDHLFRIAAKPGLTGGGKKIYAILKSDGSQADDVMIDMLRSELGVECLLLSEWRQFSLFLDAVRFGASLPICHERQTSARPSSVRESDTKDVSLSSVPSKQTRSWLELLGSCTADTEPEKAKDISDKVLKCCAEFLEARFSTGNGDRCYLDLMMVDAETGTLRLFSTTREPSPAPMPPAVPFLGADVQGLCGLAMQTCRTVSSTGSSQGLGYKFDSGTTTQWATQARMRTVVSGLAIPIATSDERVPVAVIFLSCNKRTPFWEYEDFTAGDAYLLETYLGRAVREKILTAMRRTSGTASQGSVAPDSSRSPRKKKKAQRKEESHGSKK